MLMIVVFFMNGYEACVPASIGIINTRRDVLTVAGITALLFSEYRDFHCDFRFRHA